MTKDEFYYHIVRQYDIPVNMLVEYSLQLHDKTMEEQEQIRDSWARTIRSSCTVKINPLEDREDLFRGIRRNDALRNMYHVIQIPDEIIAEMKQRTEGKSDAEMDAILKEYIAVFKECPRKR